MKKQGVKKGSHQANDYLRKKQIDYESEFILHRDITIQQTVDIAVLALHKRFGFGAERCRAFIEAFIEMRNEYNKLINEDVKNDKHFEYSKEVIDRGLKEALGKYFEPYDVRFDFREEKEIQHKSDDIRKEFGI